MLMIKLAELLQCDPFDGGRVTAKLEELGLANPVETIPATPARRTASRAASRMPRRIKSVAPIVAPIAAPPTAAASPTSRAEKLIDGLARNPNERAALMLVLDELLDDISRAADPFRSLLNFSRVCDSSGDRIALFHELHQRPAVRARLARLLSWSQALSETLVREPELFDLLRTPATARSRGELRVRVREQMALCTSDTARFDALRRFRRRETLRIGLLDMERQTWRSETDFEMVVHQISDLAQVCVQSALKVLCGDEQPPFAVLAMGKLGARELNYSSDIDLLFLHDGESAAMDKLGQTLLRELGASTVEGQLYRVDMRLRPEGNAGPLVSGFGYALSYYESYAAPWEWQALIKARAIAGDARLARRFRKFTRSITWAKRADDDHLRSIIEMKRRSESTEEGADARNVKQGPGGIRDAEWVVQQLQMMVGPQHPRARAKDSLRALEVLRGLNALSYPQAAALRDGYLFLRVLEHRLQLWEERAVRNLPEAIAERAALARRLGCTWRGESAARWLDEEHRHHRSDIRELCQRLFWGWRDDTGMQDAGAGMNQGEAAVGSDGRRGSFHPPSLILHRSPESIQRLTRLSEGSPTHPFPAPLSRQIRAALPRALEPIEYAAQPERALLNLERLCEASGNRLSLLRSLADAPNLSRAVFAILGGSQTLSDTLVR
ncbi:MAG: [glutamine synthetase] adenylyltransferase / [glutamine synthetase]-adenylyl-L-tyrosine, partial [Abditibacteriota bacterium]|nr:[glutamine synthetase] adenylyltransferase / [glutamine synthetase]-adenylyl-L-tyrosine [Abditibacteriota bacterium]